MLRTGEVTTTFTSIVLMVAENLFGLCGSELLSVFLSWYFTSAETIRLIRDGERGRGVGGSGRDEQLVQTLQTEC